jgi:hypothetical protein
LQKVRNKRYGKTKVLDDLTLEAYDKAIIGLANNYVEYDLKDKRKKYKITYRKHSHPLLIIYSLKQETSGNKVITCSLGPLGKTLLESKRYSTLIPRKYFQLNINEISTYQIALYVCRIIYIERRKKKKSSTITLKSVLMNINKYVNCNGRLISISSCFDYKGPNKKRLYNNIINKTEELLEDLLNEDIIINYRSMKLDDCIKWTINYNN